jgi:3-phosphoshikimate 1-carboxyvinyltransferase
MAFAPLALKTGKVIIDDESVVGKSYPGFWEDLKKAGCSCY